MKIYNVQNETERHELNKILQSFEKQNNRAPVVGFYITTTDGKKYKFKINGDSKTKAVRTFAYLLEKHGWRLPAEAISQTKNRLKIAGIRGLYAYGYEIKE